MDRRAVRRRDGGPDRARDAGRRRRARRARDVLPRPEPGRLPRVPDRRARAGRLREGLEARGSRPIQDSGGCGARTGAAAPAAATDASSGRSTSGAQRLPDQGAAGRLQEERWRTPPPGCEDEYQNTGALSYEQHRQCPNAQNLIAILGDTNGDRICDSKCNIQIEGTGDDPDDVQIEGQKLKLNVIRADRADGIYLKNFTVEFSDFNNIYVLETNGFRIDEIVSRYSREYGILSFTSDHGIYENCEASLQRRLRRLPGLGAERAPRPAGRARPRVRDHHPQLRLAPQHDRDVRHGRQRHVGARQPLPRQRDRRHDRLVRGRSPRHAAGQLEVVAQPDLLEQQRPVQRRARRVLPAHAVGGA